MLERIRLALFILFVGGDNMVLVYVASLMYEYIEWKDIPAAMVNPVKNACIMLNLEHLIKE